MEEAIKKSKKAAITADTGNISRGKYICWMRLELPTKLEVAEEKEVEKNCQGSSAQQENIGYGMPSLGTFTIFENIMVKIIIKKRGLKTAHNMPNTVCLYLAFICLSVN